jgi:hypothetical protein
MCFCSMCNRVLIITLKGYDRQMYRLRLSCTLLVYVGNRTNEQRKKTDPAEQTFLSDFFLALGSTTRPAPPLPV